MGRLTEDMTRLVAEINAERSERGRLIRDMKHSTNEMKRAVAHMMGRFHSAQAQMAREQRHSLRGFVSSLHNTVMGLRTDFANDLGGARAAFFGAAVAPSGRGHSRRAKSFSGEAA
jgi:hypothetical protein